MPNTRRKRQSGLKRNNHIPTIMVEKIQKTLRDSAAARWTVLVLVASMMFFAYMFVDILSPLASLLNDNLGWDQGVFGTYAAHHFHTGTFSNFDITPMINNSARISIGIGD